MNLKLLIQKLRLRLPIRYGAQILGLTFHPRSMRLQNLFPRKERTFHHRVILRESRRLSGILAVLVDRKVGNISYT